MLAVIRIRGNAKVPKKVEDTLQLIGLKKVYNCTILPESPTYKGMLQKAKGEITWGEIEEETLKKLLEKKNLPTKEVIEALGKEERIEEIKTIKLHPPKGGFKRSKKRHYKQKGELGYRGKEINQLIEKMM